MATSFPIGFTAQIIVVPTGKDRPIVCPPRLLTN